MRLLSADVRGFAWAPQSPIAQGQVRSALPLGGERTSSSRSGSSGSAFLPFRHVQARVAVRTHRSGTLEAEWQCRPHCHMASSVGSRYAQGRVAVRTHRFGTLEAEWQCPSHCHSTSNARAARHHTATRRRAYRNGALGVEWQCRSHCHSVVNVPLLTFTVEWQCDMRHKRNGRRADGFGAERGLQSSWVRDARAGARREGQ